MRLSASMLVAVSLGACAHQKEDLYASMTASAKPGPGLQQTQLAHIGYVDTAEGRYEVAVQRLVCTGMLAPRGQRHLLLFTTDGALARDYGLPSAEPLWCEQGRVYLWGCGEVSGIAVDPMLQSEADAEDGAPSGNVVDFSHGLSRAMLRKENRYGSSGGIEDR